MIRVGNLLPEIGLTEYVEVEINGWSVGPNLVNTAAASADKTIVLFGLPGAHTPTCSAKHLPGYIEYCDVFKAAGVDDVWRVSVNDAFVMGAWARDQSAGGKVWMLADGNAEFSQAIGLTLDLTARGMGLRSSRYSMLIKNGVVEILNVEGLGEFSVSGAATLFKQMASV